MAEFFTDLQSVADMLGDLASSFLYSFIYTDNPRWRYIMFTIFFLALASFLFMLIISFSDSVRSRRQISYGALSSHRLRSNEAIERTNYRMGLFAHNRRIKLSPYEAKKHGLFTSYLHKLNGSIGSARSGSVDSSRISQGLKVYNRSVQDMRTASVPPLRNSSISKPLNASISKPLNSSISKPLNASVPPLRNSSISKPLNASILKPLNASVPSLFNASISKPLNSSVSSFRNISVPSVSLHSQYSLLPYSSYHSYYGNYYLQAMFHPEDSAFVKRKEWEKQKQEREERRNNGYWIYVRNYKH